MNDAPNPFTARPGDVSPNVGAVSPTPPSSPPQPDAPVEHDTALLDQLEADLVAVDTAIETIERIAAEGPGGEHSAAEIRAAVSEERFGTQ